MYPKQLIKAFPKDVRLSGGEEHLRISEMYYDTIQGEGIYAGCPAAVLRLQGCQLGCSYCDTTDVWKEGNPYTFDVLFEMMIKAGIIDRLNNGHHLILTGGSPLLQQDRILNFCMTFVNKFTFMPIVEIENECTIMPLDIMEKYICCWNNSPKLSSSRVPLEERYKPDVIWKLSKFCNSWFKFVISSTEDWGEIEEHFLKPKLIKKSQIILMPEGATRKELIQTRLLTAELAIKNGVRYSAREHIMIWGRKIGV